MKKLIALLTALIVLTPAFAMAQTATLNAGAYETDGHKDVQASTSEREHEGDRVPKLGPAIKAINYSAHAELKGIASSTRGELKHIASSTNEMVRAKVEAIKSLIEKKREDGKKRADEAREKAHERFGAHVEELVGKISTRLASTSAKLGSIADRIDTRISARQAEGQDMSNSIVLLATARTDISAANDKILAVNTALDAAMGTTTPKGKMPAVRAAVKAAEDALKLAKNDLIKTLRSINVEAEATTTVSH